ncbi:GTP 3',8-cyclase MoaA [Armatimonadetes bacterium Uphvl-Ar1]|nr:GTP 3',8-cyclase MoaA [Armatimonadetes bacterium Uphvl-Ar1]
MVPRGDLPHNPTVTTRADLLTDRFGRFHDYLRVSITDRCNFRCVYCMPEEGVAWQPREDILTFEEIERLARFFVERGVRKIRLTGGEPSLRKGYLNLVEALAAIPGLRQLALTTNGTRLAQDAVALKAAGLASVNVSLDTLRQDRFLEITRRDELPRVLQGIEAAHAAGLKIKVNVVVLPGVNEDEIIHFGEFACEHSLTVRFIEFMPFLDNGWSAERVVTSAEIRARLSNQFELQLLASGASDLAREYAINGSEGRVAFVSSVTESFCSGCNRLRLTADGQLKSCLFLPPSVSLRDLIRGGAPDAELETAVQECLDGKWSAHPPMRNWAQRDNLTMVQIGG